MPSSASSSPFLRDHHISPTACSFGLSATNQQYFSLKTNQPPAISQQYFSLRTNQHRPSATSQTNTLLPPRGAADRCCMREAVRAAGGAPSSHRCGCLRSQHSSHEQAAGDAMMHQLPETLLDAEPRAASLAAWTVVVVDAAREKKSEPENWSREVTPTRVTVSGTRVSRNVHN
jgi:hypothetical protein